MLVGLPGPIASFRGYAARLGCILAKPVRRDTGEEAMSLGTIQMFPDPFTWTLASSYGAQWEFDSFTPTSAGTSTVAGLARQVRQADPRWLVDFLAGGRSDAFILHKELWARRYSPGRVRRERNLHVDFISSLYALAVGQDLPPPNDYISGSSIHRLLCLDREDLLRPTENRFVPGLGDGVPPPVLAEESMLGRSFMQLELDLIPAFLGFHLDEDEEEEGSEDEIEILLEEGEENEDEGEGFEWF